MVEDQPKWTVIVINLDRDIQRFDWVANQLAQQNISYIRHRALTGEDAMQKYPEQFKNCKLKAGEIGCWGSHIEIAECIRDGHYPSPALVIEDDVELPENLNKLILSILNKAPDDWDIIRLSNQSKFKFYIINAISNHYDLIKYKRIPGGTGASLINKKGAQKIARLKPTLLAIDQHFKKSWLTDLVTYGIYPAPILPDRLESSINQINNQGNEKSRLRITRF
jgi:glycosyl transferase, family 25